MILSTVLTNTNQKITKEEACAALQKAQANRRLNMSVNPVNGTNTGIHPNNGVVEGKPSCNSRLPLIGDPSHLQSNIYIVPCFIALSTRPHPFQYKVWHFPISPLDHSPTTFFQNTDTKTISRKTPATISQKWKEIPRDKFTNPWRARNKETEKERGRIPGTWVELGELHLVRSDGSSGSITDDEPGTRYLVYVDLWRRCKLLVLGTLFSRSLLWIIRVTTLIHRIILISSVCLKFKKIKKKKIWTLIFFACLIWEKSKRKNWKKNVKENLCYTKNFLPNIREK